MRGGGKKERWRKEEGKRESRGGWAGERDRKIIGKNEKILIKPTLLGI